MLPRGRRPPARRFVRPLAILPQMPRLSRSMLAKERELRRKAETAVRTQARAEREALKSPQFSRQQRPSGLLKVYDEARDRLTPRDAAAAWFALGRLSRNAAYALARDPLANNRTAAMLRMDVATSAPHLVAKDVSKALLGAAYMRTSDDGLLSALTAVAADKAPALFSPRDVATTVYALGRLPHAHALTPELLPRLLSRVVHEAKELHAVEMSLAASGLADMRLAPPSALHALSRAALAKMGDFGAGELPLLLSALASLGHHDELLLRMSAHRLPLLLTDMPPKALATTAAVLATARLWIPSALEVLGAEAALKADAFTARQAAVLLAALGRMRWAHAGALRAMVEAVVDGARREAASPHAAAESRAAPLSLCTLADVALATRAPRRASPARGATRRRRRRACSRRRRGWSSARTPSAPPRSSGAPPLAAAVPATTLTLAAAVARATAAAAAAGRRRRRRRCRRRSRRGACVTSRRSATAHCTLAPWTACPPACARRWIGPSTRRTPPPPPMPHHPTHRLQKAEAEVVEAAAEGGPRATPRLGSC